MPDAALKPCWFWEWSRQNTAVFFLMFPDALILTLKRVTNSSTKLIHELAYLKYSENFLFRFSTHSSFINRQVFLIKHQQICFIDKMTTTSQRNRTVTAKYRRDLLFADCDWLALSIYFQRTTLFTQPQFDVAGNIFNPQLWSLRKSLMT